MTITQPQILNLIVSMYNATPGAANLTALEAMVALKGDTYLLADLANDLAAGDLYKSQYTDMTDTQKVDSLMATFGYVKNGFTGYSDNAEESSALNYFTTSLAAGTSMQSIQATAVNFLDTPANAADYPTASATLANKANVSAYYSATLSSNSLTDLQAVLASVTSDTDSITTAKATIDGLSSVTGSTIYLDDSRDQVTGTSADDIFMATVGQNQDGALSNALSTGDIITDSSVTDSDTLTATLINDETINNAADFAAMPTISGVETISIQALENSIANDTVTLDAENITGETHYRSDSSRADLVITNVDVTSTQITKDITLEMKDTQQNSDLEVYFNEADLKAAADTSETTAQYFLRVGDGEATPSIANVKIDITFDHNGNTSVLNDVTSTDGTYQGLADAVNTAILADATLVGKYSAELGNAFTTISTTNDVVSVDGNDILITSLEGVVFTTTDLKFSIATVDSNVANLIVSNADVASSVVSTSSVVESDIILDNVGRSSNGGEVVVGSTSNSASSTGVRQINLIVENSSVVHDVSSTNSTLTDITLTNGTVKGDFVLTNAAYAGVTVGANGGTYSNVTEADFTDGLTSFTATDFEGNIVLGRDADILNLGALTATSGVTGNVTYNATMNDGAAHTVATGAGDDTITIDLAGSSVTINTGAGTNTVTVDETSGVSTATIIGGSGVDTVNGNDVAVTVTAADGNDVVYAENTGTGASITYGTSGLADATAATDTAPNATQGNGVDFLLNSQVKVTISTDGFAAGALTNGYESGLVAITAASGFLTTKADVNTAILSAINNDAVLSKIVTASVSTAGDVVVAYMVDGVQIAASLDVAFSAPATANSATVDAAIQAEWEETYNDSGWFTTNVTTAAAQATTARTAANAVVETITTASVAGTAAVYTVDFADYAIDTGDVITIGNVTHTAAGDDEVAADIVATFTGAAVVTIAGVVYSGATVGSTVVLTADTTLTNVTADLTVELLDVTDTTSNGTTTTSISTTTDGVATTAASVGTDSVDTNNANSVNGGAGDDVIVLSSEDTATDTVVYTDYNQGTDSIVHFVTGTDELDFTSYLTNTVSVSTSADSAVDIDNTAVTTEAFTAGSINLIAFTDLDVADAATTFATMTVAEMATALNTDANNTIVAHADLYSTQEAISVVIVENDEAAVADQGEYLAYEVTYANTSIAGGTDKDFTVTLIGAIDLGDATLAVGDLTLV